MLKLERKTVLKLSILVTILSATLVSCMFIEGTSRFTAARLLNHRVHVGKWVLEKETLYRYTELYPKFPQTRLLYGDLAAEPGLELALVNWSGIHILDEKMAPLRDLSDFGFPRYSSTITEQNFKSFVKTFFEGPFTWKHFAQRTGISISSDGKVSRDDDILATNFSKRVQGMAFGDILGDDSMELVLAVTERENDTGSTFLVLDEKGEIVYEKSSPVDGRGWSFDILDTDLDGKRELVALSDNHTYIFNNTLELEREFAKGPVRSTYSELTFPYPEANDPPHFLNIFWTASHGNSLAVTSLEGKVVKAYPATTYIDQCRATAVRLRADQPTYFAILSLWRDDEPLLFGGGGSISRLQVFASDGTLIYDETLDPGIGIATMPSDRPGEEVLLIGGTGNIYGYKWNHDKSET